jgi:hypothetical protein
VTTRTWVPSILLDLGILDRVLGKANPVQLSVLDFQREKIQRSFSNICFLFEKSCNKTLKL